MAQQRLGKGLEALLPTADYSMEDTSSGSMDAVVQIHINDIDPNEAQARKDFDEEKLRELSKTIATHGIVQPILLKPQGRRYLIIAGERRWRAARMAGLTHVPAIVKDIDIREHMEVSLIENLQRADLNPIEESEALHYLMEEYDLTQDVLANRIGKSRSAVANSLRLLNLPQPVIKMLREGKLTAGHARCLVALDDPDLQIRIAQDIADSGLSVRDVENLLKESPQKKQAPPPVLKPPADVEFVRFEKALCERFGTKVEVRGDHSKGKITIQYFNADDLERIYKLLNE